MNTTNDEEKFICDVCEKPFLKNYKKDTYCLCKEENEENEEEEQLLEEEDMLYHNAFAMLDAKNHGEDYDECEIPEYIMDFAKERLCEKEIQKENKMIEEYVKLNPYPSYDEIEKKLEKHLDLYAEYGDLNHFCCKIIYENPTNKDLIVKMGKKIYERGGMTALQSNYHVIRYFTPFWESSNLVIKSYARMFDFYFTEVTDEWRA